MVRTYDPKEVIIIVGVAPMGGFADGSFITINRINDTFSKVSGTDGVVSRAKSNDKSGEITLTLAQTSPSNDVLTLIAQADELSNNGIATALAEEFLRKCRRDKLMVFSKLNLSQLVIKLTDN